MRSFFKMFFASLLAFIVFFFIILFLIAAAVGTLISKDKPEIQARSVLVLDLSSQFQEYFEPTPISELEGEQAPSLYQVVQLIRHAKTDKNISGIYIIANENGSGPAASNEIRKALLDFKSGDKFIISYGERMSQQAYFVASVADRVYLHPEGAMEWRGYSITLPFIKGTLDKLQIQPQIFYAGKFKSATEIFRTDKMTPENRLQTTVFLNSMYRYFLQQVAQSRGIDTAALHSLAANVSIRTPQDAVAAKLVDAVKYDDEVRTEVKGLLKIGRTDKMTMLPLSNYSEAVNIRRSGTDRIALILAEGNIVDGDGSSDNIGGERFRALIRKARLDNKVKAIVLRVNSGGGSALASEVIWREIHMARTEDKKPVIVSFGDVAASGGYYIACGADSIFASPNTITGSIGVFGVIPNMENFFKEKLGVTFDHVSTAPYAEGMTVVKPLSDMERLLVQNDIERIYAQFKRRVAEGRKMSMSQVDSIAQGRVWSGADAKQIGLVDRMGTLDEAIASAAKMAGLSKYSLVEYPEKENWLKSIINQKKAEPEAIIKSQVGEDNYRIIKELKEIREMAGSVQARLPFQIIIR